ncbi:hypothetical protein [Catenuloplanes japonicus]|uniref:hypothetical protein n=1 Tax=Catenuloplanes japonicus TaxID=33876 RepID=UPI0012FA7B35|nr:hypothetical protein [Catenuloplanes japonicus]
MSTPVDLVALVHAMNAPREDGPALLLSHRSLGDVSALEIVRRVLGDLTAGVGGPPRIGTVAPAGADRTAITAWEQAADLVGVPVSTRYESWMETSERVVRVDARGRPDAAGTFVRVLPRGLAAMRATRDAAVTIASGTGRTPLARVRELVEVSTAERLRLGVSRSASLAGASWWQAGCQLAAGRVLGLPVAEADTVMPVAASELPGMAGTPATDPAALVRDLTARPGAVALVHETGSGRVRWLVSEDGALWWVDLSAAPEEAVLAFDPARPPGPGTTVRAVPDARSFAPASDLVDALLDPGQGRRDAGMLVTRPKPQPAADNGITTGPGGVEELVEAEVAAVQSDLDSDDVARHFLALDDLLDVRLARVHTGFVTAGENQDRAHQEAVAEIAALDTRIVTLGLTRDLHRADLRDNRYPAVQAGIDLQHDAAAVQARLDSAQQGRDAAVARRDRAAAARARAEAGRDRVAQYDAWLRNLASDWARLELGESRRRAVQLTATAAPTSAVTALATTETAQITALLARDAATMTPEDFGRLAFLARLDTARQHAETAHAAGLATLTASLTAHVARPAAYGQVTLDATEREGLVRDAVTRALWDRLSTAFTDGRADAGTARSQAADRARALHDRPADLRALLDEITDPATRAQRLPETGGHHAAGPIRRAADRAPRGRRLHRPRPPDRDRRAPPHRAHLVPEPGPARPRAEQPARPGRARVPVVRRRDRPGARHPGGRPRPGRPVPVPARPAGRSAGPGRAAAAGPVRADARRDRGTGRRGRSADRDSPGGAGGGPDGSGAADRLHRGLPADHRGRGGDPVGGAAAALDDRRLPRRGSRRADGRALHPVPPGAVDL